MLSCVYTYLQPDRGVYLDPRQGRYALLSSVPPSSPHTVTVLPDDVLTCIAIEGNPDLAGIGVRVAFYIQSAINTLLVIVSPRDSVPSAWAGTLLTTSLVIAAIVQKVNHTLTLHHATLIMNFATLSCISSFAVAPMLPIWRLRPSEYYAQELARNAVHDAGGDDQSNIIESPFYINRQKKHIKAAQNRERVILALALLTQVVLQWTWGIILFVSPTYSQKECSGDTVLLFFLYPFRVRDVKGGKFVVWPFWLIFTLGITLALTINLALSSPNRAHDSLSRRSTISMSAGNSSSTPVWRQLARLTVDVIPSWQDRPKQVIFWGNTVSFILWCLYLISSEWQRSLNHISEGEDDFGGFGQVTAIFLSLAPLWSLSVALYKYPSLRRRQERHRQRVAAGGGEREYIPTQHSDESRSLLAPLDHSPQPSGTAESFQLSDLGPTPLSQSGSSHRRAADSSRGNIYVVTVPSPEMGLMDWEYHPDSPVH
ncbi:unnamed protein product [Somion occarium]|uniref:Uncharacterized protein n=1 Tax=Somion occarium TaxID=3059160 RepID=A0ABP1E145_9APHY